MRVTVRYICGGCGWKWIRDVHARQFIVLDRPILVSADHAPCCRPEEGSSSEPSSPQVSNPGAEKQAKG